MSEIILLVTNEPMGSLRIVPLGNPNDNVITVDSDRNEVGDIQISEVLKQLVVSIESLKKKNRELEKRNAELVSALQHANDKIAKAELYPGASPELGKAALKVAADVLKSAEIAMGAVGLAAQVQAADRYRNATRRVLELQKEMMSLLEATREEVARFDLQANERTLDILLESRESILSIAEDLDVAAGKSSDSHFAPIQAGPESLALGPDGAAGGNQATGTRLKASGTRINVAGFATRDSALRTQRLEHRTQDPEPRTQNSEHSTHGPAPSTQDSTLAQSVDLIASPFQSFGDLLSFQKAVKKLPGVIEVEAQSFNKGTMRLRIKRHGTPPLSIQLAELTDFPFELLLESENSIEIRLI